MAVAAMAILDLEKKTPVIGFGAVSGMGWMDSIQVGLGILGVLIIIINSRQDYAGDGDPRSM